MLNASRQSGHSSVIFIRCIKIETSPSLYKKMDFQEALLHSRRKTLMKRLLQEVKVNYEDLRERITFEYIFADIYRRFHPHKGLKMLATYDTTSVICRYYGIPIDPVYIIGNGPKRAAKILNLPLKMKQIGTVYVHYADTKDVLLALEKKSIYLDIHGDALETYLCHWQKKQKTIQFQI